MLKIPYQKLRLSSKGNLNLSTSSISNNNSKSNSTYSTKTINGSNTTNNSANSTFYRISRRVLQDILVLSIFAFLGILSMMIGLDSSGVVGLSLGIGNSTLGLGSSNNKAYAESIDDTNMPTNTSTNVSGMTGMDNGSDASVDTSMDTTNGTEEGIAPYATTASLSIGGAGETEQVVAGRGTVTYRTHTVRVQASEINNYSLTISGPSNLVSPTGSGSESAITGISNKTGSEMGTSSTYDNTWGYGWGDTSTSEDNLVYRTLSTTGTDILTVNGSSDKPALSNRTIDFTRKLVFAVKFGEDAMAGRYYANVTLSLTASPAILTTYSITYNGNGNTGGSVPTKQEASVYDTTSYSFTVPSTTLTKTGYNFLGWSESSNATTVQYAVGATILLTQSSPSKVLYAVWEVNLNWNNITEMQQMTLVVCAGASIGATKTLTDIRDGSTYTVAKLVDNNCWMTQNLRLTKEGMAKKGFSQLTSSDSDVSSDYSLPTTLTSASGAFTDSSTAAQVYYANNVTYGAYYSWRAATAESNTDSNLNALYSICPKGWTLPTGGTEASQFYKLYEIAGFGGTNGSKLMKQSPYNFVYAGYVSRGNAVVGSEGNFWSSHYAGTNIANRLFFNDTLTNPSTGYSKIGHGLSVRCIARSN